MSIPTRGVGPTAAIIVAAGKGERLQDEVPKQYLDLGGRPVLSWSLRTFLTHTDIDVVVVVLAPEYAASPPAWLPAEVEVAAGGDTRAASVRAGLSLVDGSCQTVLVHDGARPFVTEGLISRVVQAATGPVIPVLPLSDTVKVVDSGGRVLESPPRETLFAAQTPQGFPLQDLLRAHSSLEDDATVTDDAVACERCGLSVATVPGDANNFKITTNEDLSRARWMVDAGLILARI